MKKILMIVALCVMSLGMISCGNALETGQTTIDEMEMTEKNQVRLIDSTPPPEMTHSLERENLARYLKEINREDRITYIYLVSFGKVMTFYTVKGKVTYCSSKLTTRDQVVEVGNNSSGAGRTRHVLESPGLDGSYGPSEDAIFFWTTDGVLVQWRGDYMWVTEPLQLVTPPALVRQLKDK